ncbi:hypothetical protein G3I40_27770 [Streptomyces sp. SID14478]|uniref:hypothetical protein n=1 Tax=Streptomyces sp. SID14478 TaxID=2706073 RepID=UPI0013DC42F8|nr:hypothetical protein [Streptomyces sp. SID14478]NEB78989.1 hypothetical protein [Streptomyces sp. SID14478]
MATALRIDVDTTVSTIDLPEDPSEAYDAIRREVGEALNQGVYHRRAVLHIGDTSAAGTRLNLTAWTLASAWRGIALYPLHGTIVVTGPDGAGETTGLDDDLVRQAEAVAVMVRETVARWQDHPPVSNETAAQELLAYAAQELEASS